MKLCTPVVDYADSINKSASSVLTLAYDQKIKVMVPIHQIIKAIKKPSKTPIDQIDFYDPIGAAMTEIWQEMVYLYYVDQKESSRPSKAEIHNSFSQLISEKNYEIEDVRESKEEYFEVPPDSLKGFIQNDEEVGIDIFHRIEEPVETDTRSGKVWFFEKKIQVRLSWLVIDREEMQKLNNQEEMQKLNKKTTPSKRVALDKDQVESKTYHLWFISDYIERNKKNKEEDWRTLNTAWGELKSLDRERMVPHPSNHKESFFIFKRHGHELLMITEIQDESDYDAAKKRFSNQSKEFYESIEYVHQLKKSTFKVQFYRKLKDFSKEPKD